MDNIVSRVRDVLGLSCVEIAALLGVHRSTVERWERKKIAISRPAILALEGLISTRAKPPKQ